jgi:hypothetical protein
MLNKSKVILTERWALVALGSVLLCLGVSGASIWMDEASSARVAVQPTLATWISTLNGMQGSEPQMPGYLLYLWVWVRLFGASEWALRLANLPWAVLFTASLAWGVECVLNIRRAWLIICLSPFVWFYMNEARPYAMLMGLSMVSTIAVLAYARNQDRFRFAPWWAMISLLVLWSTHMLTITLAPSLLIFLCAMRPTSIKKIIKQWFLPVVITLPFFSCLAIYYLRTLADGKGGIIQKPGLANFAYAIYELLGFGGLGPPRNVLRQSHDFHTLLPYFPGLGLGVLAFGIVTYAILRHLRHSKERWAVFELFVALAAGLLITFAISYVVHFRLLGRHVATFFPFLALLLLAGLRADGNWHRCRLAPCALLLLGIVWSISDLRQRLLPSYEKDDYRDAAALAHIALMRGEPVLWQADREAAMYYGLRTAKVLKPGSTAPSDPLTAAYGACSLSWFRQSLQTHRAVLVVMSNKADIFDPGGECRNTLDSLDTEHLASLSAFDVLKVTGVKSSSRQF